MTRTFVAVPVAATVQNKAAALIDELRTAGVRASWVATDHLHLTLKFLGDVAEDQLPHVSAAAARVAADTAAFEIELRGAGAFPDLRRPRTIWLGTAAGREPLIELQRQLDAALRRLGFPRESRPFAPHLTLGRIREFGGGLPRLVELLRQHHDYQAGTSRVASVCVLASELRPEGPRYTVLADCPVTNP